jgi:hypothetical protein
MKTKKEVDFLVCGNTGVTYTRTPYLGASVFYYRYRHKPSGKTGQNIIYGVSPENGRKLIEHWNRSLPDHWEYWENIAANANNPKFVSVNKRSRAQFAYRLGIYQDKHKWMLIWDKDLGDRSVTNDIDNVVADIAEFEGVDALQYTIVYRDSTGRWDGWDPRTKNFYPWNNSQQNKLFNHLLTVGL